MIIKLKFKLASIACVALGVRPSVNFIAEYITRFYSGYLPKNIKMPSSIMARNLSMEQDIMGLQFRKHDLRFRDTY